MDSFIITSTPLWSNLSTKNLLDNNLNTPFFTNYEKNAWLIIDMQVEQKISYVTMYMQFDAQYTYTHVVQIGNTYPYRSAAQPLFASNPPCADVFRNGKISIYNCMTLYGRYLSVQTMDSSNTSYLTIMDMTIGFTEDRKRNAVI